MISIYKYWYLSLRNFSLSLLYSFVKSVRAFDISLGGFKRLFWSSFWRSFWSLFWLCKLDWFGGLSGRKSVLYEGVSYIVLPDCGSQLRLFATKVSGPVCVYNDWFVPSWPVGRSIYWLYCLYFSLCEYTFPVFINYWNISSVYSTGSSSLSRLIRCGITGPFLYGT